MGHSAPDGVGHATKKTGAYNKQGDPMDRGPPTGARKRGAPGRDVESAPRRGGRADGRRQRPANRSEGPRPRVHGRVEGLAENGPRRRGQTDGRRQKPTKRCRASLTTCPRESGKACGKRGPKARPDRRPSCGKRGPKARPDRRPTTWANQPTRGAPDHRTRNILHATTCGNKPQHRGRARARSSSASVPAARTLSGHDSQ